MISNVLIIGAISIVLLVVSAICWAISAQHDGMLWKILFGILFSISGWGVSICFIALIVLLIIGG